MQNTALSQVDEILRFVTLRPEMFLHCKQAPLFCRRAFGDDALGAHVGRGSRVFSLPTVWAFKEDFMFGKIFATTIVTATAALSSATAWGVAADTMRCRLEVRNASDSPIATAASEFFMARLPQNTEPRAPGFQETWSSMRMELDLENGVKIGAVVNYLHATNGTSAYQLGQQYFDFCYRRTCESSAIGIPGDPNDPNPYSGWTPVAIVDGIPQLDSNIFAHTFFIGNIGGKTYRGDLKCKHLGTYL